jgi:hypothetical protein
MAASLRMASSRRATTSPERSDSQTLGPQTGQALGWAWKRRLAGSSYSRLQSGQSGKQPMDVFGRS